MIIRTSYAFEYMLACVHWQNILMRLLTLSKKETERSFDIYFHHSKNSKPALAYRFGKKKKEKTFSTRVCVETRRIKDFYFDQRDDVRANASKNSGYSIQYESSVKRRGKAVYWRLMEKNLPKRPHEKFI